MDSKSENSLTQIQKYKALLAIKRRRGNDKMPRKSKKKIAQSDSSTSSTVESVATGPSNNSEMTESKQNMILQDTNKQNNENGSNIKGNTMTGQ